MTIREGFTILLEEVGLEISDEHTISLSRFRRSSTVSDWSVQVACVPDPQSGGPSGHTPISVPCRQLLHWGTIFGLVSSRGFLHVYLDVPCAYPEGYMFDTFNMIAS